MGELIGWIVRDLLTSLGRLVFDRLPRPAQNGCAIISLVFIVPLVAVTLYVLITRLLA